MIEISKKCSAGFEPIVDTCGWKVALISAHEQYAQKKIIEMKRHNTTDEVFILLRGSARLRIMDRDHGSMDTYALEPETVYNVKKGTWHYLEVSDDALIAVTESNDISVTNTERMRVNC